MKQNTRYLIISATYFEDKHADFGAIPEELAALRERMGPHAYISGPNSGQITITASEEEHGDGLPTTDITRVLGVAVEETSRLFAHRQPDLIVASITAGPYYYCISRAFRTEQQAEQRAIAAQVRAEQAQAEKVVEEDND